VTIVPMPRARRRLTAVLALGAAVPALLVGCGGGGSGGGGGSDDIGAVAPKQTTLLVSADTAEGSEQLKLLRSLADRVPALGKLLDDLRLDQLVGVAGPQTHALALNAADVAASRFLGLTQPASPSELHASLEKLKPPPVVEEIAGWQVFAERRATIDAFKDARREGSLADDPAYEKATKGLPPPDQRVAAVYAPGAEATALVGKQLGAKLATVPGLGRVGWLAGSVSALDDGLSVRLRLQGDDLAPLEFTPQLLDQVPENAFLAIGFKGLDKTLDDLRRSPLARGLLGQAEAFLGGTLDDLVALFRREGVLFAVGQPADPGIGLVLKSADPQADLQTLNGILSGIAPFLGGTVTDAASPPGAKHLHLSSPTTVDLYYTAGAGTLAAATTPAALAAIGGDAGLASSAGFQRARSAAKAPSASVGYVWADLQRAAPLLARLLKLSASTRDLLASFGPSYTYATVDGDVLEANGVALLPEKA
jgi:hypothetical protein